MQSKLRQTNNNKQTKHNYQFSPNYHQTQKRYTFVWWKKRIFLFQPDLDLIRNRNLKNIFSIFLRFENKIYWTVRHKWLSGESLFFFWIENNLDYDELLTIWEIWMKTNLSFGYFDLIFVFDFIGWLV